ncbi:MAG: hypothetical protein PHY64_03055 [Eubacteriales bacterium]|nr:hypothetical protein [Eubacteriales bacterium]
MGTVTAVDESAGTVTVSGMIMQDVGVPGNGQPGDGTQNGSAPSGNPPQQGDNGQQGGNPGTTPSGNPPQQNGSSSGNAPDGNGQVSNSQNGAPGSVNGQGAAPNGQAPGETTYTVSVTDATAITSQETQATLSLADLAVGTRVEITLTGDETNGYTATVIQTQPDAQPATDTAAN